MTKRFSTSDFLITYTSSDFVWLDERMAAIPIVHWPDGRICQPLLFYFAQAQADNRLATKSLETIAYTLREWFCFLYNRNKAWSIGNNQLMRQWRQDQKDVDDGISDHQIEAKLSRVLDFYTRLPQAMAFDEDGQRMPVFVGPEGSTERKFAITTKIISVEGKRFKVWSGHKPAPRITPEFSTLSRPQVLRILNKLRIPNTKERNHLGAVKAERDFLLADVASGGGLRASEIADLSATAITQALRDASLILLLPEKYHRISSVVELAGDRDAQETIIEGLYRLRQQHRHYLFVRIVGKGSKPRKAAFYIQTIINILEIGIWGFRPKILDYWHRCGRLPTPSDNIFLSLKSSVDVDLTRKSVSKIMKEAFIDARVEGSAHDLRKHYGTRLAISILRRTLKNLGYFTDAVLNTVLSEVADALGHSKVTTTTRHYVHLANVYFQTLDQRTKSHRLRKLETVIDQREEDLSDKAVNLLVNVTQAIADQGEGSRLFQFIERLISDPKVNGSIVEQIPSGPILSVVGSNSGPTNKK